MKTLTTIASFFVILMAATGCELIDPIVGEWESDSGDRDYPNELELDEDMEGEATLYFSLSGVNYSADFDVECDVDDNGDYECEFECEGDCSSLDFDMECEIDGEFEELECEGDGLWEEYDFEWEKVDD
jgi:hypothetical protein